MNARLLLLLFSLFGLVACEGGTGGSGGTNPNPPAPSPLTVTLQGHVNKGPLAEGEPVTIDILASSGTVLDTLSVNTQSAGGYAAEVNKDVVVRITANGRYYSEHSGEFSASSALLRGVQDTARSVTVNVNVLTHLIHDRVLHSLSDGVAIGTAINAAQSELTAAFAAILPEPSGTFHFTDLMLINSLQDEPQSIGNGYLLALTSVLEQVAIARSIQSGADVTAELIELLSDLSIDLADDGRVSFDINEFRGAVRHLDPNQIHQNLLDFDPSFLDLVVSDRPAGSFSPGSPSVCRVRLDKINCFDDATDALTPGSASNSAPLDAIVADMNQFIDTDGDGEVNSDDEDDDGDGIVDEVDTDPYKARLLNGGGSEEIFVLYMKRGLAQWSNPSDSPPLGVLSDVPFSTVDVPGVEVTDGINHASDLDFSSPPADFTQTNVLVAGVDEIDPVKYDGEYLFLANDQHIQVVKTLDNGAAAQLVSARQIQSDSAQLIRGIYLADLEASGRTLAAISEDQIVYWLFDFFAPTNWQGSTHVEVLDANDVEQLRMTTTLDLDGSYVNSRRVGNTLYLITRYSPQIDGLIVSPQTEDEVRRNESLIDQIDVDALLPKVTDGTGRTENLVTSETCFVPPLVLDSEQVFYPTLTTITSINLDNPAEMSSLCLTDGIQGLHVSEQAIYIAAVDRGVSARFDSYPETTVIHKFAIAGGAPEYRGSGRVPGVFWGDPSFLMGEHDDNLTVVTTSPTSNATRFQHNLTILGEADDQQLVELGRIPNKTDQTPIGKPGEQIFASRIFGDRAYVVTFEQVDPIYVIDLSDPTKPTILGALEIPGFSNYLHPINDDLLIGIGRDAEADSGQPLLLGINIRLFDVSDPTHPGLLSDISIGKRGTETPVLWDPHSFTILKDQQSGVYRLTVPVRAHGLHPGARSAEFPWEYAPWTHTALYQFEVSESQRSLTSAGVVIHEDIDSGQQFAPNCCNWTDRSFLNGDLIHYLSLNNLITTDWAHSASTNRVALPTVFAAQDPDGCTPEVSHGLYVLTIDQNTGRYLDCADVRVTDGDFSQTILLGCNSKDPAVLEPAFDRPGRYEVKATRTGYKDWVGEDIVVQTDGCHVQQTSLNIFMEPL